MLLLLTGFLFLPSPYTIILALPVFLIGLLLIWTSKLKNKFKVLCTIMPIVLFVPYAQLVMYLFKNSLGSETKIDLIIDEDFYGKIVIINNLDCSNKHEVGKRTKIFVPENGITHYNGEPIINNIFTRVLERNKKGETKELNWNILSKDEKGIIMDETNGIVYDGESYKVNVIVIGKEIQLDIGIASSEEEIKKYIKKCKNEHY